jgi:hypothetical protein
MKVAEARRKTHQRHRDREGRLAGYVQPAAPGKDDLSQGECFRTDRLEHLPANREVGDQA